MSSMKKGLRRVAAVAVATLVVAPALATVASATSTFAFDRIGGSDRYATSVLTGASFGTSTDVILASGVQGHFPDALSASYFAGFKKAPILLTKLAATPANIVDRITASGATKIWLIGGTGVISSAQEAALDAKFGTVTRLAGDDRYKTSEAVIKAAGVAASTTKTAILATGVDFPDALGAGALSYKKGMPVALTATNSLPAETLSALKAAGITNVIALGGPTVVGPAVLATLTANSITSTRIFGNDRGETSTKLADYMITSQGFLNTKVNVASGYRLGGGADALGAAAVSGKDNTPTLITNTNTAPGTAVLAFLKAHSATLASGHIFGLSGAVSAAAEALMQAAARTVTSNQTYSVTGGAASVTAAAYTAGSTVGTSSYTANVPAGTTVHLVMFDADNVSTASGTTSVARSGAVAVTGSPAATIRVVNGFEISASSDVTVVSPASGQITFVVSNGATVTTPTSVVPVVYKDTNANGALNVGTETTTTGVPVEPFGVGPVTTFFPAAAASGDTISGAVTYVDIAGGVFISSGLFHFASTDTYAYSTNPTTGAATFAGFNSRLSVGDTVTGTYTPLTGTTFTLNDANPPAVSFTAAPTGTGSSILITITQDQTANVGRADSYNVYRKVGATSGSLDSTYTKVGNVLRPSTLTDKATFTDPVALPLGTNVGYFVVPVTNGLEGIASAGVFTTLATPAPAETVRPTSILASLVTDGGLVGDLTNGDVFAYQFNEEMKAPVSGATIRLADGDGTPTVADAINGTNATFALNAAAITSGTFSGAAAGTVLTVTMNVTPTPITAGTFTGLQYPVNVTTSGGITDLVGNTWNVATTAAVKATALTQGITVTWGTAGVVGNTKSIVIVQATTAGVTMGAAVSGDVITVTLGTNAGSAPVVSDRTAVAGAIAGVTGVGSAVAASGATAVAVNASVAFTGGAATITSDVSIG